MNKTQRIPAEVKTAIRKRRKAGATINVLQKEFRIPRNWIMPIIRDIAYDPSAQKRLVASTLHRHPDWTDQQIAEYACCDPSFVAERRELVTKGRQKLSRASQSFVTDQIDTGARIPMEWMLRHCSQGQRTLAQIQACWGSSRYTIRDIQLSAIAAGLPVHPTTWLVGVEPTEEPRSNETPPRRFRFSTISPSRRKTY